ncbi:MAG: hypothetical protein Q4F45_08095 [Alistipes sp.]|nr:hypothetical protein [Alistipes sp.]
MKKFLLMAVAAFGMLMTACSKDEVAQPVGGEESVVTFTVEAPVMATRAHGDGLTATDLTVLVYQRGGALLFEKEVEMVNLKATVELPFVNGMEYDLLFWAEAENSPYSLDKTNKTVTYTDAAALVGNSEAYDAFYAYVNDIPEITGPVTKSVELKRPFAQLNIITNDAAKAEQSGVVVEDVKVVVKKGYTAFDFVLGNGINQGAVTFGPTAKQSDTTLAVNYLFTGGEKSLVDVEFTYTDEAGKLGTGEVKEFAAVPVQRNYRTNIVGSLLTSDGTFEVEIKPGFDGEPGHEYKTTSVVVPDNNTEDVVISTETIEVTVPATSAAAGDNFKIVVSNESTETDATTGETTVAFDLTLYKNNVKVSGDVIYEIAKNVGAGKIIAEVKHNETALTNATTGADQTYSYDSATGVLTIYTKSFSPFAISYADYKDYVRTKNFFYGGYISVSTGSDLLPIVAIMPEITKFCVFDGDTRITDSVTFRFSNVKKETINENSYKVSLNLAILNDKGNDLELKPGMPSTLNGKEYLHVYMNTIDVPAGYSVSEVKVNGTSLTQVQLTSGSPATGEYWVGADPKDVYFQSQTAGLIEVVYQK